MCVCIFRKLEDKGLGELSFDEVYRALLLGAVPPTLVSDAVRLLAAGRPGEGGGAGFLSPGAAEGFTEIRGSGDNVRVCFSNGVCVGGRWKVEGGRGEGGRILP